MEVGDNTANINSNNNNSVVDNAFETPTANADVAPVIPRRRLRKLSSSSAVVSKRKSATRKAQAEALDTSVLSSSASMLEAMLSPTKNNNNNNNNDDSLSMMMTTSPVAKKPKSKKKKKSSTLLESPSSSSSPSKKKKKKKSIEAAVGTTDGATEALALLAALPISPKKKSKKKAKKYKELHDDDDNDDKSRKSERVAKVLTACVQGKPTDYEALGAMQQQQQQQQERILPFTKSLSVDDEIDNSSHSPWSPTAKARPSLKESRKEIKQSSRSLLRHAKAGDHNPFWNSSRDLSGKSNVPMSSDDDDDESSSSENVKSPLATSSFLQDVEIKPNEPMETFDTTNSPWSKPQTMAKPPVKESLRREEPESDETLVPEWKRKQKAFVQKGMLFRETRKAQKDPPGDVPASPWAQAKQSLKDTSTVVQESSQLQESIFSPTLPVWARKKEPPLNDDTELTLEDVSQQQQQQGSSKEEDFQEVFHQSVKDRLSIFGEPKPVHQGPPKPSRSKVTAIRKSYGSSPSNPMRERSDSFQSLEAASVHSLGSKDALIFPRKTMNYSKTNLPMSMSVSNIEYNKTLDKPPISPWKTNRGHQSMSQIITNDNDDVVVKMDASTTKTPIYKKYGATHKYSPKVPLLPTKQDGEISKSTSFEDLEMAKMHASAPVLSVKDRMRAWSQSPGAKLVSPRVPRPEVAAKIPSTECEGETRNEREEDITDTPSKARKWSVRSPVPAYAAGRRSLKKVDSSPRHNFDDASAGDGLQSSVQSMVSPRTTPVPKGMIISTSQHSISSIRIPGLEADDETEEHEDDLDATITSESQEASSLYKSTKLRKVQAPDPAKWKKAKQLDHNASDASAWNSSASSLYTSTTLRSVGAPNPHKWKDLKAKETLANEDLDNQNDVDEDGSVEIPNEETPPETESPKKEERPSDAARSLYTSVQLKKVKKALPPPEENSSPFAEQGKALYTTAQLKKVEPPNEKKWQTAKAPQEDAGILYKQQQLRKVAPPIEDKWKHSDSETELTVDDLATRQDRNQKVLMLLSSSSGKLDQKTAQDRALIILKGMRIDLDQLEQIDGADPQNRERRDELFAISGIRAKYPQFFLVDANDKTRFLGDWEAFESLHDMGSLSESMNLDSSRWDAEKAAKELADSQGQQPCSTNEALTQLPSEETTANVEEGPESSSVEEHEESMDLSHEKDPIWLPPVEATLVENEESTSSAILDNSKEKSCTVATIEDGVAEDSSLPLLEKNDADEAKEDGELEKSPEEELQEEEKSACFDESTSLSVDDCLEKAPSDPASKDEATDELGPQELVANGIMENPANDVEDDVEDDDASTVKEDEIEFSDSMDHTAHDDDVVESVEDSIISMTRTADTQKNSDRLEHNNPNPNCEVVSEDADLDASHDDEQKNNNDDDYYVLDETKDDIIIIENHERTDRLASKQIETIPIDEYRQETNDAETGKQIDVDIDEKESAEEATPKASAVVDTSPSLIEKEDAERSIEAVTTNDDDEQDPVDDANSAEESEELIECVSPPQTELIPEDESSSDDAMNSGESNDDNLVTEDAVIASESQDDGGVLSVDAVPESEEEDQEMNSEDDDIDDQHEAMPIREEPEPDSIAAAAEPDLIELEGNPSLTPANGVETTEAISPGATPGDSQQYGDVSLKELESFKSSLSTEGLSIREETVESGSEDRGEKSFSEEIPKEETPGVSQNLSVEGIEEENEADPEEDDVFLVDPVIPKPPKRGLNRSKRMPSERSLCDDSIDSEGGWSDDDSATVKSEFTSISYGTLGSAIVVDATTHGSRDEGTKYLSEIVAQAQKAASESNNGDIVFTPPIDEADIERSSDGSGSDSGGGHKDSADKSKKSKKKKKKKKKSKKAPKATATLQNRDIDFVVDEYLAEGDDESQELTPKRGKKKKKVKDSPSLSFDDEGLLESNESEDRQATSEKEVSSKKKKKKKKKAITDDHTAGEVSKKKKKKKKAVTTESDEQ